MPWLKVSLPVAGEALPTVEAVLGELGAQVMTILPQGDELPWEAEPGVTPQASANWVSALFGLDFDGPTLRSQLEATLSPEQSAQLAVAFVADEDWCESYRQFAVADCFAERLWLLPKDAEPVAGPCVRLDPGLAFGTGSHPTTRLCLERMAQLPLSGLRVLDYGCGSGVLGLAALALGAEQVVGVDYDPQALVATRDNAVYNGFSTSSPTGNTVGSAQFVVAAPGQLAEAGQFDMIVANILANPLIELAPQLIRRLVAGGRLLLAGLLASQAERVCGAYRGLRFPAPSAGHRCGEWVLLEGLR